jgi:ribosome biogenesis GTPase
MTELADLGWSERLEVQLAPADAALTPLRITEVQRTRATGLGTGAARLLEFPPGMSAGEVAVGDWVLADPDDRIVRVLDRQSLISRKAAGVVIKPQLIAANVDTLFITTSCNADFSVPRLERYVAMALEAGSAPVIVITKADLAGDAERFAAEARAISDRLDGVVVLNARDPGALTALDRWIAPGETIAFVGSSGVGKSTLVGGLTGAHIATQGVREDDAKGRHTTTARSLHVLARGGLLIDMPGMRELAMVDAAEGIDDLFDDLAELESQCRFRNCAHDTEPGCAVRAAIEAGDLDAARYARWQKLKREDARNTTSIAEARKKDRAFGRMVQDAKDRKGRK